MDRGYDTLAFLSSEVVKQFTNAASLERIEPRGWFIKHDETGVGNQFDTDGGTLALAAGKNLAVDGTDLAVGEVGKPEVFHDLLDELVLVFLVGGQFQTRRKCERLFNGKVREEHVVLHDVGGETREVLLVHGHHIVDEDVATQFRLVNEAHAVRQDVQQTSFACAGAAHNVEGLTGRCVARGVLDNFLANVLQPAVFFTLLFGAQDFDFEPDVRPAQLHGGSAETFGICNQFHSILHLSCGEGEGTFLQDVCSN